MDSDRSSSVNESAERGCIKPCADPEVCRNVAGTCLESILPSPWQPYGNVGAQLRDWRITKLSGDRWCAYRTMLGVHNGGSASATTHDTIEEAMAWALAQDGDIDE